jgi:hypothetical protein
LLHLAQVGYFLRALPTLPLSVPGADSRSAMSDYDGREIPSYYTKGQVVSYWWVSKRILNDVVDDDFTGKEGSLDPVALVLRIKQSLQNIRYRYIGKEGAHVNYEVIKASKKYRQYLLLVNRLKHVPLEDLDASTRKSLLINLYNCLIIHAIIVGMLNATFLGQTMNRLLMYATASYR